MSGLTYKISLDGGALLGLTGHINNQVMPLIGQAVRAVAQQAAADWTTAIHKAKLWSGEKDAYAQSIKINFVSDFEAVVESDYKHAQEIETGRPQYDLKKMLDTSLKVRLTKGGKRFLAIPFRHNTPGNGAHAAPMPAGVAAMAKAMEPSRVVNVTKRQSGEVTHLSPKTGMHAAAEQKPYLSSIKSQQAAMVAKRNYAWGARLTAGQLKAAGMTHQEAKRYAGMVKMDTSTPGGAKSSAFMTFRIMMEGSNGWIVPAKPGLYIVKKVTDDLRPKAEQAFQAAVAATVKKA